MKRITYIFLFFVAALFFVACSNDEDTPTPSRTVMYYFNSENNINDWAKRDIEEIVTGSYNVLDNVNLLAFYDDKTNKKSYIYKITKGTKSIVKDYGTSIDASSPENMLDVLQTMTSQYPAKEYVSVFWGHGTGAWFTADTTVVSAKAFGADFNSSGGTSAIWINIPQMANVLKQIPKQKLIMFDTCLMQSIEVDYELKDCTDYIVSNSCETPTYGANYMTLTPILASTSAEGLPKAVVDDYTGPNNLWSSYKSQFTNTVMSAVKTSELDNLLNVTKSVLNNISTPYLSTTFSEDEHNATNCIFYYRENTGLDESSLKVPIFHDMKDVMRHNLSENDFSLWCNALDNAVIYKNSEILKTIDYRNTGVKNWISDIMSTSDFNLFYVDQETCGALSMFIPDGNALRLMNTNRFKYQWWQKIGK